MLKFLKYFFIIFVFNVFLIGIYSNTLQSPFVFDDLGHIVGNEYIKFTKINVDRIMDLLKCQELRPVSHFSFALNFYFGGEDPVGYHVVNLFVHLVSGIFLFIFIRLTLIVSGFNTSDKIFFFNRPSVFSSADLISFFSALIWVVHPINTQSVTYIVQRMNSLAAMFYVMSLICYVKGRISQQAFQMESSKRIVKMLKSLIWFSGCLLTGMLGLGSKQNTAMLPLFILSYELFFFQDLKWDWIKAKIFWISGLISIMIVIGLIFVKADPNTYGIFSSKDFSVLERLFTQTRVIVYYLGLIAYPHPLRLNLDYDYPPSQSLISLLNTSLASIVLIGVIFVVVYRVKNYRIFSFCILWFFGNLIIESSVFPLTFIYEHRTYLPSMLICFLFVYMVFRYFRSRRHGILLLCAMILFFSIWTYQRNEVWRSDVSLWKDCIAKSPEKARPYCNLGGVLHSKHNKIDEAMLLFKEALRLEPHFPMALRNLGVVFIKKNNYLEAIHYLDKAVAIDPNYSNAHYHLAMTLIKNGELNKAAYHLSRVIRINPMNLEAHINLGNLLSQMGKLQKALQHYYLALQINPNNAFIHNNLANAYIQMGNVDKGIKHYKKALQIDPEYINAQKNLDNVLIFQNH